MRYFTADNFLSKDLCTVLIECESNTVIKNGIITGYDEKYYNICNKIIDDIKDIIKIKFNDDVELDNFNIKTYWYKNAFNGMGVHVDDVNWIRPNGVEVGVSDRIYTVSMVLNSNFIGGRFIIDDEKISPITGQLIVFPSYVPHGVEPLIAGSRFVFLSWFNQYYQLDNYKSKHLVKINQL